MPLLCDSHCHIDAPEFDADRNAVLQRARDAGVGTIVAPAVAAQYWDKLRVLCAAHPQLHPAYGLHPLAMGRHGDGDLEALREALSRGDAVAVGECGLDFWEGRDDADRQLRYLDAQLHLARDFDLPVVLHARRALDEVTARLRRIGGLRGVVHSFAGSEQQAQQLWGLGFHVGIGGPVTYPRAQRLRRIVASMPIDWLLLETDSPDQPGVTHRGARNEPAFLTDVLAVVAELRGEDVQAIAERTSANCRRLFVFPDG
jgi:TatD DNase family protein